MGWGGVGVWVGVGRGEDEGVRDIEGDEYVLGFGWEIVKRRVMWIDGEFGVERGGGEKGEVVR